MSRLFMVRHGPTHAKSMVGWSDLPADLSDTAGIGRLADHLPRDAMLISSDLTRAVETANAVARGQHRLPHNGDLREIHFGDWELKRFDEVEDQAHIRKFWEQPGDIRPPRGESWNEMTARVDRGIDQLIADYPNQDLIVVAHFGAVVTQIQRAERLTAYEAFGHKIDNLSVTEFEIRAGQLKASSINRVL